MEDLTQLVDRVNRLQQEIDELVRKNVNTPGFRNIVSNTIDLTLAIKSMSRRGQQQRTKLLSLPTELLLDIADLLVKTDFLSFRAINKRLEDTLSEAFFKRYMPTLCYLNENTYEKTLAKEMDAINDDELHLGWGRVPTVQALATKTDLEKWVSLTKNRRIAPRIKFMELAFIERVPRPDQFIQYEDRIVYSERSLKVVDDDEITFDVLKPLMTQLLSQLPKLRHLSLARVHYCWDGVQLALLNDSGPSFSTTSQRQAFLGAIEQCAPAALFSLNVNRGEVTEAILMAGDFLAFSGPRALAKSMLSSIRKLDLRISVNNLGGSNGNIREFRMLSDYSSNFSAFLGRLVNLVDLKLYGMHNGKARESRAPVRSFFNDDSFDDWEADRKFWEEVLTVVKLPKLQEVVLQDMHDLRSDALVTFLTTHSHLTSINIHNASLRGQVRTEVLDVQKLFQELDDIWANVMRKLEKSMQSRSLDKNGVRRSIVECAKTDEYVGISLQKLNHMESIMLFGMDYGFDKAMRWVNRAICEMATREVNLQSEE